MGRLRNYTSPPAIGPPGSLLCNSTDTPPAPGPDTPILLLLCVLIFFAAPTFYCVIIRRLYVRAGPRDPIHSQHRKGAPLRGV
ncbi:hypothetical protein XENTR_v10019670 [Xenopus tropicalis]|nr:hypothetical protein XENTR_v10019670 [Xenopus tropicalis]